MIDLSTQRPARFRVLVIGGGIGGLALASGLRRAGIDVTVFERDLDLAATGGYHITLRPAAQTVLAELLPESTYARLLASAADNRLRDDDVFWDHHGRRIGRAPMDETDVGIDVDRITLRLLLAEACGDALRLGKTFTRFTRNPDGTVTAHFEDGESVEGDLLIAADGTHSRIARDLAGRPTNAPTGLLGVSGRTRREDLDPDEQERLGIRSSFAIGPYGTALYYGYLDPIGHRVDDAVPGAPVTSGPTYIWGAILPESARTAHLRDLRGAELRDAVAQLLLDRGWTRRPLQVLDRTDPDDVALYRFHAASMNARDLAPWEPGNVLALGDAVHATPPTAGMGAGIAIQDAADLVAALVAVQQGQRPYPAAIEEFHAAMRERGAAAISVAMRTVTQVRATATPVGAALTRALLPVLAAAARWRTRPDRTRRHR